MSRRTWHIALLACAAACMLSGCGQKTNTTDQEAYRQYGINCIESGDYQSAVDAFQKALDQSHGKVTAAEIDICYYKAEAQFPCYKIGHCGNRNHHL